MSRHFSFLAVVSGLALLVAIGCRPQQPFYFHGTGDLGHYVGVVQEIEYPDTEAASLAEVERAEPPLTVKDPKPKEMWDLALSDAIRYALQNGEVLRNLGGVAFGPTGAQGTPSSLLQSPASVSTTFLPALTETNARSGVEAALSAFDAQFSTTIAWEKNVVPQNVAGFVAAFRPQDFRQDTATFQAQIAKIAADGTQWFIRHNVNYSKDNSEPTLKLFPAEYDMNVEAEFRHPFLQGAGVGFNRIAGPGAVPGFNNGVMIARVQVDQSLADFEGSVRNFVADVERAYWNLYYAYRRLDAAIEGRDRTLNFWRGVYSLFKFGSKEGPGNFEAQARGQYYQFEGAVQDAQNNLYKTERVLRYMMGLAASDGRLIYPTTEPTTAEPVVFDWADAYGEALVRSVELRKQKWRVKQAELELMAAKNWLLPRLDAVGRYRWAGLGANLIDPDRETDATGRVLDATSSMTSGRFPSWHLGMEFRLPFGFRREMAGVRFSQLTLTQQRKLLQEQELELGYQLQDAFGEMWVNYKDVQSQYNRWVAAKDEVDLLEVLVKLGKLAGFTSDLVLQAYQRRAVAEDSYYRSLTDYNLAIMQVHLRKGSLLEYDGVYLAEGPWPAKAYFDARRRARARDAAHYINYGFSQPKVLSRGPYQQFAGGGEAPGAEMATPEGIAVPEGVPMGPGRPLAPIPANQGSSRPEKIPAPQPVPEQSPAVPGGTPDRKTENPSPPDQAKTKGPALSLAPAGKRDQNGESSLNRFDLGSLDLSTLAGKADNGSPAPVQAASYQHANPTTPGQTPKASSGGWTSPQRSTNAHEPFATSPSAATDQSASGWKAAQH
jgi:outer membrane protein TolC